MKQTLEEAAQSMAYNKMPVWGGLPALAKKYFIKGAEWQSKQSPWISVKERLPNNDNNVLVCNNRSHFVGIANYYKKPSTWGIAYSGSEIRGVTHWCPIPSFDEILEANKDVLERIKEKGD